MLKFAILGPIELSDGNRRVPLSGPRQISLLAFLLLHANHAVSADELVAGLWRDDDTAGALKRLQVGIARLRKALEPLAEGQAAGPVLRTVAGGYLLGVAPGDLDSEVFAALADEGHRALQDGGPQHAAETLAQALALWRGPALPEVVYEDFAQAEIRRLGELRLAAVEARVEADLQLGRHASLVGELEGLVAAHPTRERLFGQLMLSLYRCGRQAEALDVYQRVRSHLAAELGLEPGPALRALEQSILVQAAELERPRLSVGPAPQRGTSATLPTLLVTAGRTPFIGREEPLKRLQQALERTYEVDRVLVLLEGEPGIGKTRLASEFARLAHESGALVLYGRCPEEPLVAYQAFIEALGPYVATAAAGTLRAELGMSGGELTRLLPMVAQRFPELAPSDGDDPGGQRLKLFDAVDSFLAAASRARPVILILDDLHWADRPSVLLIRHLVRAADPARLLLVAASRDTERPRTDAVGAALVDLDRHERVEHCQLTGMTEREVNSLVARRAGRHVPSAVRRTVFERSAGNPFFAAELVRNLQESGVPSGSTDTVLADAGVPLRIMRAIGQRLERLSKTTQSVLAVGALLGPDLELELLGRVNELSHEQLVDVLDEASEGGFIAETDRTLGIYGFRHALIRETLVDRLSAARRAHCHQQIATALEATELEARLSELAHHLLAAAPLAGSAARARAYALRAAEQATARLAYDEAARQLRVALAAIDQEPAPSEAQRCDILIALGEAELRTGETDTARRVFDEAVASARRLDDARGLARAALGTAGARPRLGLGAADTGAMTVPDEALSALGAADSPLRVRVLSRLATELYWSKDRERGNQLTREALTVARRVGEPSALASSLHAAFVHDDHPDSLSRRSELAGEIRALALRSNDPRIGIWAEHFTVIEALELGDIANADAALARYTELAEQLRHPMHRWHATMWAAMRHLLAGRFDLAERSALEAHAAGERAQDLNVQQTVAVQLATVRWEQGRSHEFIPALRTTIERDRAVPAWRAALALSYADCDDRVHARETLESLAGDNFESLPRDSMWLGAVALLAETCGYLGDVERAATLTHLLEPYAKRVIVVGNARVCMGSASHYLGVLGATRGDLRDAAHHFEASIEVDEHLQAPPRVARSQYAYARLLLARNERGDKDRARELLDRAQNAARELGMRRLLAQICATRDLSGIRRSATAARDGPDHGAPPEAASAIV